MNVDLDAVVADFIRGLPGHSVPDEDNRLPDGKQFKAPDHEILQGEALIERKTLNSADDGRLFEKIIDIAKEQGTELHAFGMANAAHLIRLLPQPEAATRRIIEYSSNQLRKTIRKTRKKFMEYGLHRDIERSVKILIVTDRSDVILATDFIEFRIGKMMMDRNDGNDEITPIDLIIYLKHPKFVLDRKNSYWFKALYRDRIGHDVIQKANIFSSILHEALRMHPDIALHVDKFKRGSFRPVVVDAVAV